MLGEGIVTILLVVLGVWAVFKLFGKSMKLIFKLLLNTGLGYVLLFIINFVGSWVNISIAVNWVTALVTGVLGLPGVILMLVLQLFG